MHLRLYTATVISISTGSSVKKELHVQGTRTNRQGGNPIYPSKVLLSGI